ncbi:hypothetical protein SAMN05444161_4290 [Rhizobiales bacterium GAS191]|nr:hypothetical protein SAMN05444161_4290 [Rhizobiales bacterium GAS191]
MRQPPETPHAFCVAMRQAIHTRIGVAPLVLALSLAASPARSQNTNTLPLLRGTPSTFTANSSDVSGSGATGSAAQRGSTQTGLAQTGLAQTGLAQNVQAGATSAGAANAAGDEPPLPAPVPPTPTGQAGASTRPIPGTPVEAQTRRRFNLTTPPNLHGIVQRPVYVATSPDRTKRQSQLPPKLSGVSGTPDHPASTDPVVSPAYTDAELKRLAAHKRELRDADPYAPLGLRIGSLYVTPSIEESVGYDTNPGQVQGGKGSRQSRTDAEVKLRSDWSSNELTADLRGGYSYFPDVKGSNRPDGDGKVDLRVDATNDLNFQFEGRGSLTTQQPGSVNLPQATQSRPLVWGYGGSVGTTYHPGYWTYSLRGNIDRTEYENAKLADGTTLNQSDRNVTQYELRARLGYDLTPGIKPFVEARLDTRQYDQTFDSSGFDRSSNGIAGFGGMAFEFTRKLTGEVSLGYGNRSYDDPRLKDLRGPLPEASLIWSVTPLTTVTLKGSTQLVETTLAGSPGAVERQLGLEVSHALLRNLIITGTLGWTRDQFQANPERDTTVTAGVKAEWKLNRNMVIKASFLHTQETSNVAGRAFGENTYLIGMRWQY